LDHGVLDPGATDRFAADGVAAACEGAVRLVSAVALVHGDDGRLSGAGRVSAASAR
jgi:hypothetical protein